jgi:hypothetical protein
MSDINIRNWNYDTNTTETGIMLVESIQNFKTYFSNIVFDADFNINVDFTRLSCDLYECPADPWNKATYNGTLSLKKLNMSLSQQLKVDNVSNTNQGVLNPTL